METLPSPPAKLLSSQEWSNFLRHENGSSRNIQQREVSLEKVYVLPVKRTGTYIHTRGSNDNRWLS